MILLVLYVLLSWESESFKEFSALEKFFFQHFVFFKHLELIIIKKKKNPSCGILLFPWKLIDFSFLAFVSLHMNTLSLWKKELDAQLYCTLYEAVTHPFT